MLARFKLRILVSIVFLCWCYPSIPSAADPLIIDEETLSFNTLYTTTVYRFRAFPVTNIVTSDLKSGLAISADVLKESFEALALNQSATLYDIRSHPWESASPYTPVFITASHEEKSTLAVPKLSVPSSGRYDARFIVAAFGTELVDTTAVQQQGLPLSKLSNIKLNPKVAMDFLTVYSGSNSSKNYEAAKIPATFNRFDEALAQQSELYAVAKIPLGEVKWENHSVSTQVDTILKYQMNGATNTTSDLLYLP
jgi:hypothetical protein